MGLTGTFEGWVPTATDIYLRGYSSVSFSKYSTYEYPLFESGQITLGSSTSAIMASLNLTSFTRVNFEIYKTATYSGRAIAVQIAGDPTRWAKTKLTSTLNTVEVISVELGSIAVNSQFSFEFIDWRGVIYHIWLS